MKKIKIYAKEKNKIEIFLVSVNEDKLKKILNDLDNYYETEMYGYMIYFKGKNDMKKSLENFIKNENDIFDKIIEIKELKNDDDCECIMTVKRESKLTNAIRTIINNDSDKLELSYAFYDIYNFKFNSEIEKNYMYQILSCFSFYKKENKLDMKKILLQIQYEMEDEIDIKYCDDETLFETQKLPYSYNFNNKMNK